MTRRPEALVLCRIAASFGLPVFLALVARAPSWFCVAVSVLGPYIAYEFDVLHRRIDHLERNGWLLTGNTSRRKKEG